MAKRGKALFVVVALIAAYVLAHYPFGIFWVARAGSTMLLPSRSGGGGALARDQHVFVVVAAQRQGARSCLVVTKSGNRGWVPCARLVREE